ncbi:hypothetical protein [Falsiroseomonas sp. CW058]|uniref:hypothetical protein n=1 Tax=Falsiroseomonas sp. CW058 TaxID=3388664 RepID=UPI003D31CC30
MSHGLHYGYQVFDAHLGSVVRPGEEVMFLADRSGAMRPINIGERTYRIFGPKGAIVNWMVAHGTQRVRVGRGFAGAHHLALTLHRPQKTWHEMVSGVTGSVAGAFMPAGAFEHAHSAMEMLHAAHEVHGGAGDMLGGREVRAPAAGAEPKHYLLPGMTAPKILDISLGVSRTEKEACIKWAETGQGELTFSQIAAWMFGS